MNIYEKLMVIQDELKAPKNLDNNYGNYKYRSAEKIFEAAKPICSKHKAVVFVTDDVVEKRGKLFLEATATLIDVEMANDVYAVAVKAYAEIPEQRKGMDASQVTGASSSYARKYALNGLFAIDDSKDADVPPGLPDKREDFEAYADKVYGKREKAKEKEKAMEENQKKLDEAENWRYISADNIEVKRSNGQWINLDDCYLPWLEALIKNSDFDGIKADIQKRIDLIKKKE